MSREYWDKWLAEELNDLKERKDWVLRLEQPSPQKDKLIREIESEIAIKERLIKIQALYRECEEIAESNDVHFYTPGPEYGMGGSYWPKKGNDPNFEGWHSSNTGC